MLSQEELTQVQAIQAGKMRPERVAAATQALVNAKAASQAATRNQAAAMRAKAAYADMRSKGIRPTAGFLQAMKSTELISRQTMAASAAAVRSATGAVQSLTPEEVASVQNELKFETADETGMRQIPAAPADGLSGLGLIGKLVRAVTPRKRFLPRGLVASRDLEKPVVGNHMFYGGLSSHTATQAAHEYARARAVNENALRQKYNGNGWTDDRLVSPDEM